MSDIDKLKGAAEAAPDLDLIISWEAPDEAALHLLGGELTTDIRGRTLHLKRRLRHAGNLIVASCERPATKDDLWRDLRERAARMPFWPEMASPGVAKECTQALIERQMLAAGDKETP